MIRILTQIQYDAICDICREAQEKIENLEKENEQLKAQIKAKDDEIDEQAQEIYGLREDLASLKWNLNKLDPNVIDFPNSDHKASSPVDKLF